MPVSSFDKSVATVALLVARVAGAISRLLAEQKYFECLDGPVLNVDTRKNTSLQL